MRRRILFGIACLVMMAGVVGVTSRSLAQSPEDEMQAGDTRTDDFGIEQVWVPAGCFMRGTTDEQYEVALAAGRPFWATRAFRSEQPAHEVCLSKGYWIDKFEVTNAAFDAFVAAGGYENEEVWSAEGWEWVTNRLTETPLPLDCLGEETPEQPRVCVTWYEAEAYANWRGGRLPTEAEWEFAARGPEATVYPWGNEFDETLLNMVGSTGLTAVGSYPDGVSWVGALDMAGNAMEWVNDWLDLAYYELMERDDPQGPAEGNVKIEKGGWWGAEPFVARSAYHHFEDPPTYEDHHIGFRIVTDFVPEAAE